MKDRLLSSIVEPRESMLHEFDTLMPWRVRNLLLVSSLYDSYTIQEDGRLSESLFSEYQELNLRYAPNIRRASITEEAIMMLQSQQFDLVISTLKIGDASALEFYDAVNELGLDIPIVLLANNPRELAGTTIPKLTGIDRVFVWGGDVRLFLAIIKSIEDRKNAWHDASMMGVPVVILIEDNVRFYSSYLPMLYTEIMEHSQALMSDALNHMQRLLRMRARPKVLLASSYEEGMELFEFYKEHVIGVIVDAAFPRNGKIDEAAGIELARVVRAAASDRPILMQSSDQSNAALIERIGGQFVNKHSPTLLHDLRKFMRDHLGFGPFKFYMPNGQFIAEASDLRNLKKKMLEVPGESIIYHSGRNDFSTWLMNRTEFALARDLKPLVVDDFSDAEEIRAYLILALERHMERRRSGVIADFSSDVFEGERGFVRLGTGSLGGKGRGLAFVNALLDQYKIQDHFDDFEISVPPTAVLAAGVFDKFMDDNDLWDFALGDQTDEAIIKRFINAQIPSNIVDSLRVFLADVHYPLAVRSSSLLEDSSHQPFAGVYETFMIPNSHTDMEVRLGQLLEAVKKVYASTYFQESKDYITSTSNRQEEEKMGVLIQQVVGREHDGYYYPSIAGVARSYNYYPMEGAESEDGVASVVLGLGKSVVDGGRSVRFSPKYPRKLFQFSSAQDTLKSAQSDFLALDIDPQRAQLSTGDVAQSSIVSLSLDEAERHETLHIVGSVYDADSLAVYDGISRPGPRLVTMAGVLKTDIFPIAQVLDYLLKIGSVAFARQVEIEFAANFRSSPGKSHRFSVLQIRPVVVDMELGSVQLDDINVENALCISPKALGNGRINDVRDIVYVPKQSFDRAKTVEVAGEIDVINRRLNAAGRPYLLIGPGRWGSSDHWLGIPVSWGQISGAACIVETDMQDIKVAPSQGTHFFQNMTSLGVAYFTVNFEDDGSFLNLDRLDKIKAETQLRFVRHLSFDQPIDIAVNGREKFGVIMAPGEKLSQHEE